MIKLYGGCGIVFVINFVMFCFMLTSIYYSNVLLEWTDQTPERQQSRFNYYTITIFAAGTAIGVFVYLRVLSLVCGSFRAVRILHNEMLNKVLSAPINLFYDVTPIGKILNRFSKDLSVLDSQLLFTVGSLLACSY